MTENTFTPAPGRFAPTRFYDRVVALTRERLWRSLAALYVAPRPDDVIVDVGCGTGSLALLLARVEPRARLVGVDPDPEVLAVAGHKASGATVRWQPGMGDALPALLGPGSADTVVSSLVLHQCPIEVKQRLLASMWAVLRPGGKLVIADYGHQRTPLMRLAFLIVQLADGREDTRPNADGRLPALISEAGFRNVREAEVVATVSGSISVYVARKD
ncbi:class I SAM-dependent methyltransferase [Pseudonocardia spinosispora]|uniref:class I SAM-dependent methyltransferase n=1 Tax=Pseudonocardia spinosispora TaxID=103441 RepID=UPI0003F80978|nr:class I SAM-dependent methyltransferase [Pseudonocardia spinosispora]